MRLIVCALASVSLVACSTAKSAETSCNDMIAGDAEAMAEIMGDGVEPAALCACVGTTVDAMAEDKKTKYIAVMNAVTDLRKANDVGVESAAELLEEKLRSGSGDYAFTEGDFQNVGRMLNDLSNDFEDGGSCKAG